MNIDVYRRRGVATVAVFVVVVGAATGVTDANRAGAAASPTPQPVVVTVTNPGDAATAVDLTPVATVGTTTVIRTKRAMIGTISGPAMTDTYDLSWTETQRNTVTAANPDGSGTVTYVIEDTTATTNAGNVTPGESLASNEPLRGLPIEMDHDPQGAQTVTRAAAGTSPTAEQLELIGQYAALGATGPVVYPADPVGVGATWTATLRLAASWCDLPLSYSYRLVSGESDQYTIEYTWGGEASPLTLIAEGSADTADATMSATVSGTGTITRNAAGTNSVATNQGHYRFVATSGGAQAIDEYDLWNEWNTRS